MSKFDIEKFPTSETAKRMLRRVSPIYGNAYTAKWLYQVMGMEWDEARDIILSLREQAFTQTVTWGIEFQEHKYSITPDDTLSLEERRARLYRRKTKKYPLNPRRAEMYFENGWNTVVDIDETVDYGYLKLTIISGILENIVDAIKDFRRIKPSHLILLVECTREVDSTIYVGASPSLHRRYVANPKPAEGADAVSTIYTNASSSVYHRIIANPKLAEGADAAATVYVNTLPSTRHRIVVSPKPAEDADAKATIYANALPSAQHRIVVSPRINLVNEAQATPNAGGKVAVHRIIIKGEMNNG